MKFLVERDALKDALSIVGGRTKGANKNIPILMHVLAKAEGNSLALMGHDQDSCSTVTIPAEVTGEGAVALPGDRLAHLIAGFPEGSQVICDTDDRIAKVRCGRSSYQMHFLPASDFPFALTPDNPTTFTLSAEDISRLFKIAAPFAANDQAFVYRMGVYLHLNGSRLASVATDGHTLLQVISDVEPPKFTGVIVPDASCLEFARIAAGDEARIEISRNLIAIESGNRRFVSKLVDATFPETYARVIPSQTAPFMTVTAKDFAALLARLSALHDPKHSSVVRLHWGDEVDHIKASLRTTYGSCDEQVECDCPGRKAGEVGARVDDIRKIVNALGGSAIRLLIDGPADSIRIEDPSDLGVVAVCMPCRL